VEIEKVADMAEAEVEEDLVTTFRVNDNRRHIGKGGHLVSELWHNLVFLRVKG